MTIAVGGHSKGHSASSSTCLTTACDTTGGSSTVFSLFVEWYGSGSNPTSITDNKGNTYTQVGSTLTSSADATFFSAIYEKVGGTGGTGLVVTVTCGEVKNTIVAFFIEGTGLATSSPRDQAPAGANDSASPYTSSGATTTQADELLISYAATHSASGTEVLNWTANSFTASDSEADANTYATGGSAYRIVSSTGTYSGSVTSSGAGTDSAMMWIVTYKGASGGPTISVQPASTQVKSGATASFSVTASASGGGTLSYQWKLNGSNVSGGSGGTTASYTTPTLAYTDNLGSYTCDVTETGGSSPGTVSSSAALVYVGMRVVGANTPTYSASAGSTVTPSYSTLPTILSGDEIFLAVAQKPSTANGGTVTTPTGYTLVGSLTAAGGYSTTLGNNTGNTNLFVYRKTTPATGSETGTITVTVGTNGICWATFFLVRPAPGTVVSSVALASGSDTTGGNVSITVTDPGIAAGDLAFQIFNGSSALATYSGQAITTTGVTYATTVELAEPSTTLGNDVAGYIAYALATAGPSSAGPVFTATTGGTTTNARGPGILLRVRAANSATAKPSLFGGATTIMI